MGKAILYLAWAMMITGVIVNRFIHPFPDSVYIPFLGMCMLLGIAAYLIEHRKK